MAPDIWKGVPGKESSIRVVLAPTALPSRLLYKVAPPKRQEALGLREELLGLEGNLVQPGC